MCFFLCCRDIPHDDNDVIEPKIDKRVKIRVGWSGKDTLFEATVNIKATFGKYAVLLDKNNRVVPLSFEGFPCEVLARNQRYCVVLNTHGSSKQSWDKIQREGFTVPADDALIGVSSPNSPKSPTALSGIRSSSPVRTSSPRSGRTSSPVLPHHHSMGDYTDQQYPNTAASPSSPSPQPPSLFLSTSPRELMSVVGDTLMVGDSHPMHSPLKPLSYSDIHSDLILIDKQAYSPSIKRN
eukprot:TRINITY_DN7596_c0_g1_i1.p1 TRINITY_DN7596_c0_g1~~TRINITY_DN7596_c0_g1_i1.p1  ORF type:complete len:238 (-),score=47.20 TRINITY_DN7596_c0_g1_i1:117-830(-)